METEFFDKLPQDRQLVRLLAVTERSNSLSVSDTPSELRVEPRGISLWFVCLCMLIPLGRIIGIIVYGYQTKGRVDPNLWIMAAMAAFVCPMFVAIIHYFVNGHYTAMGTFSVIEKAQRRLLLPRYELKFGREEILEFVFVKAWHTEKSEVPGRRLTKTTWLAELSVLAREPNGRIARYSVACCESVGKLRKIGERLSRELGVKLRQVKLD